MSTKRFPWGRTFLLGFGFLGISIIWPIFNQYVPLFLQAGNPEFEARLLAEGKAISDIRGFGLTPALAMFVMTWDNILNMFIAPWAGSRSDRTWNRFGRRKGWILLGAPIALLSFVFIPVAQSVLAILVFILITNFGMALFRAPTIAWLGDLFDADDRSKANGVINLMGGVGGLLAYFGGGLLFNTLGRSAPFVAGALVTAIALVTVLVAVREPRDLAQAEIEQGGIWEEVRRLFTQPDQGGLLVLVSILFWFMAYNALETGLSSFAVFTLGMKAGTAAIYTGVMTVSFIVFAVPAGMFGTRYGRAPVIRIGLIGLTLLTLAGYFLIRNPLSLALVLALAGALWSLVNVNSLPLVYDHGDERRIGAYTGLYYFSSQLAAILGPTLGGVLVEALGNEYRWLWLFGTLFMGLALSSMSGIRQRVQK